MSVTRARVPMILGTLLAVSLLATACGSDDKSGHDTNALQDTLHSKGIAPKIPQATVRTNVAKGASAVPVDHRVTVTAHNGTLNSVSVSSKSGSITGKMTGDKRSWTAGALLEPGTT